MIKTTQKRVLIVFVAIIIVALVYIFIYLPNTPLEIEQRDAKLKNQYLKILHEKFDSDARFQQVTFQPLSRYGDIEVKGVVAKEEDIHLITNAIESIKGQMAIEYVLDISNESVGFYWNDMQTNGEIWFRSDSP